MDAIQFVPITFVGKLGTFLQKITPVPPVFAIDIYPQTAELSSGCKTNYARSTIATGICRLTGLEFDDLDGQEDALGKCQSITSGPHPEIRLFSDKYEEQQQVLSLLNKLKNSNIPMESICITARTNEIIDNYSSLLGKHGVASYKISRSNALNNKKSGVRLATMHRVKGIEFDYVILVSACEGIIPAEAILNAQENAIDRQNVLQKERSLLYVALTRARKAVFITGYKKLSDLLTLSGTESK